MGYDSEIDKIFIKKKKSRGYKKTSLPPSPNGDSKGISLNNYQGLNNVTGEGLSANEGTQHQHDSKTNFYSPHTNKLPKLFKPANGESRKLLPPKRTASSMNNLDDDEPERRRSKGDTANDTRHFNTDKKLTVDRQRQPEKNLGSDKREDFVQIFSQLINKEPETRNHNGVERQKLSNTSANKRENLATKNLRYYENAVDNESDTNIGSIQPNKCYYTDVIDLRNQSDKNGEDIPQQISYYKPEPALTNDVRRLSGDVFEMRTIRLNEIIESRKYAGCKLALPCIPEIKRRILKSFKNKVSPGLVSQYTMNRGSLKCSVSGELKGLVEPILSKSEKIEKAILWKPKEEKEYQKELVPLSKYFKKCSDDQKLKQLCIKKKVIGKNSKLERKASIITVASNSSIESMGFTELRRQPKLRPWTPEPKFNVWGYDSDGDEIEDPPRPACLDYGFASNNNSADSGAQDVDPSSCLQSYYIGKASGKTAEEILQIRKAENPNDLVIEDLEYAEDYLNNLNFNKVDPNEEDWRERVVRKRDRKTGFSEGSYHPKSVVEDELPKVLRFDYCLFSLSFKLIWNN